MEKVDKFFDHLECIMAFWYIIPRCGHLVIYWPFGIFSFVLVLLCHEKSGNPVPNLKDVLDSISFEDFLHSPDFKVLSKNRR
jgi:hypothetical protein